MLNCLIIDQLEAVTALLSIPIYWLDTNNVVIGCNEAVCKGVGSKASIVGKTALDLYPYDMAIKIIEHNQYVINTGKISSQEEAIKNITTGKTEYFLANKAPLRDNHGNIIGLVGTSIDITAQKEAEIIKLEHEKQQQSIKEQKRFIKAGEQLAHDIRSPLTSLMMIVDSCKQIPETERIGLREAANSASNIADNFLAYCKKDVGGQENQAILNSERTEPTLVSAVILQLLADKKYEYKNASVTLNHKFNQTAYFAFINVGITSFKRMLSNLINNARDAFYESDVDDPQITVSIEANSEWLSIAIKDNGKGMPPALINKIKQGIAVTQDKKDGHGIGLTQVHETLARYHGKLDVLSTVGKGSSVILTFPKTRTPNWVGDRIQLGVKDTIVILDDDNSIHIAWDSRLKTALDSSSTIKVKHFHDGEKALKFIQEISLMEKSKVFLLSDFELLNQRYNGLEVIEKSRLPRHLLVTSHYANAVVREHAARIGVKILPKQLASNVIIDVDKNFPYQSGSDILTYDVIIVDDDELLSERLSESVFDGKKVVIYHNPLNFLKEADKYNKDALVLLDNNYQNVSIKGIEIAKVLHEKHYKRLYLLSGNTFKQNELPNYLTAISKADIRSLRELC